MNNYERNWFNKFFPTIQRLKAFRKKYTQSSSSCEIGSCGKESLSYNYGPQYQPHQVKKKETQWIWISKHKIDQAIREKKLGKRVKKINPSE